MSRRDLIQKAKQINKAYSTSNFEFQGSNKETGRWICDQEIKILDKFIKDFKDKKISYDDFKIEVEIREQVFNGKIKIRNELLNESEKNIEVILSNNESLIFDSKTKYRVDDFRESIERANKLTSSYDDNNEYDLYLDVIDITFDYISKNINKDKFNELISKYEKFKD